jgi:hypothetical protein
VKTATAVRTPSTAKTDKNLKHKTTNENPMVMMMLMMMVMVTVTVMVMMMIVMIMLIVMIMMKWDNDDTDNEYPGGGGGDDGGGNLRRGWRRWWRQLFFREQSEFKSSWKPTANVVASPPLPRMSWHLMLAQRSRAQRFGVLKSNRYRESSATANLPQPRMLWLTKR